MNSTPYRSSTHLSVTLKTCHPERSLAESEANRQTESKDPYQCDTADAACLEIRGVCAESRSSASNFRIVVRFFDEHESELRSVSSCEAAAWESPARQCRVSDGRGTIPAEPALSKRSAPKGTALSNKRTT